MSGPSKQNLVQKWLLWQKSLRSEKLFLVYTFLLDNKTALSPARLYYMYYAQLKYLDYYVHYRMSDTLVELY